MLRLIHIEDWHTIDRRSLSIARSGVEDVVGPDDDNGIGIGKLIVDRLHLVEAIVVYISLGEEHVHMSRHTTSDRVDGVLDFGTVSSELVSQLLDLLLRLC